MHTKKKAWLVLVVLTVVIKLFSFFPYAVEKYYSAGFYPLVSRLLRILFGWLPFSLGDILYLAAGLYLLIKTTRFFSAIIRRQAGKIFWWNALRGIIYYGLAVYVLFNILWGLNYNRLGVAYQVRLQMKPYSTEELKTVMEIVVKRLNTQYAKGLQLRQNYAQKQPLQDAAAQSYQLATPVYPWLVYRNRSVKASLFSYLGDYMGYLGYYNPFTGEAQVNMTVPVFVLPFTACHEMGHQLGYAKENEANFAGYLSAKSSDNAAFRYSVYFELYNYGIRELYGRDSIAAIALNKQKPEQVKKDIIELRAFYTRYENPVEPYIRKLYGQYLKANEQPSGMQSYNEVMAFLIAYYKKYGEAAL